jgi:anti-sigma factor RsiW
MDAVARRSHPDLASFHALVDGEASPAAALRLARHLDGCPRCRRERAGIATLASALESLPAPEEPQGFTAQVMARIAPLRPAGRPVRALRLVLPATGGLGSALAWLALPSAGRVLGGVGRLLFHPDSLEPSRLLALLAGIASAVVGGLGRAVDGLAPRLPAPPGFPAAGWSPGLLVSLAAAALLLAASSTLALALAGRGWLRARPRKA